MLSRTHCLSNSALSTSGCLRAAPISSSAASFSVSSIPSAIQGSARSSVACASRLCSSQSQSCSLESRLGVGVSVGLGRGVNVGAGVLVGRAGVSVGISIGVGVGGTSVGVGDGVGVAVTAAVGAAAGAADGGSLDVHAANAATRPMANDASNQINDRSPLAMDRPPNSGRHDSTGPISSWDQCRIMPSAGGFAMTIILTIDELLAGAGVSYPQWRRAGHLPPGSAPSPQPRPAEQLGLTPVPSPPVIPALTLSLRVQRGNPVGSAPTNPILLNHKIL